MDPDSSDQNSYNSQDYELASDDSENFRQILVIQKELRSQKMSRKGQKIPEEIAGLMGEANQHFINSQFNQAIQKLYEIIRQYPNFPEPFNLLGLISEEKQEIRKSAHFFRLAAEMSHDKDLWEKIGFMYKNMQDYEQASICFGRALKSDPLNSQLIKERADCCEKYGDLKKSAIFYEKLVNMIDSKELIRKTAKMYAKAGCHEQAIRVLKKDISKNNVVNIHMIVELYQANDQYSECIEFMDKYFTKEDYQNLPEQLFYQYLKCLINQKRENQLGEYLNMILKEQIEFEFDVFFQIARLLEQNRKYEHSREVLEFMMNKELSENQLKQLYTSLGQIYQSLNDDESAIDVYLAILKLDVNGYDMESRMALSDLYKKQGNIQQALQILRNNDSNHNHGNQIDIFESEDNHHNKNEQFYKADDILNYYQIQQNDQLKGTDSKQKDKQDEKKASKGKRKTEVDVQLKQDTQPKQETTNNESNQDCENEILNSINQLNSEINIQSQKMVLQKGSLLIQQEREIEYIDNSFDTLIQILNQEYMVQLLKEKIVNIYYGEQEQKIPLKEQWNLIRNKKQRQKAFLYKRKRKYTEKKMNNWVQMMNNYSKVEGKERLIVEIRQMGKLLIKYSKDQLILQLVLSITRLNLIEINNKREFLIEGLQSSLKSQNYEIAFHLIKKLIKFYKKDKNFKYIVMILSYIVRNLKDASQTRAFILKMAKKHHEDQEIQQLWFHILGNSYLQSGFYDLAIKMHYSLFKQKPTALLSLQLASSYLQESLRRTQTQKQKSLMRCIYFLQIYKKLRLEEGDYESEVHYNQGRVFSQVGYFENAIDCFREALKSADQTLHNKSVYNLVVLYKRLGENELAQSMIKQYI